MKTRNIIMLAIVASIFVTASILVALGVATHEEPTLRDTGRWDDIPITVSCPEWLTPMSCPAAQGAILDINQRVGFRLLRWVGEAGAVTDITITDAPSENGGPEGGVFELTGTAGVYEHCTIVVTNTVGILHEAGTAQHELLHCVGLAHDDYRSSIMFPEQRGTFPLPRISDADRRAIRQAYAGAR